MSSPSSLPPPLPKGTHHPLKLPVLLSPENGLFRLEGPVLELATDRPQRILTFHQRAWVKRQLCLCKSQGKVALCISCVMLRYVFRRPPLRSTHRCVNEVIQAVGKFLPCLRLRVRGSPFGRGARTFIDSSKISAG